MSIELLEKRIENIRLNTIDFDSLFEKYSRKDKKNGTAFSDSFNNYVGSYTDSHNCVGELSEHELNIIENCRKDTEMTIECLENDFNIDIYENENMKKLIISVLNGDLITDTIDLSVFHND